MIQPKYSPEEALKRAKLMMGYDPTKTLTENEKSLKPIIKEDSADTDTENAIVKILAGCSSRPASEGSLDAASIAAAFNQSFNYQTWGFLGGTDDSLWREQATLMKKGNYDDLCNVKKEFEDAGYGDFATKLVDELDDEELAELMKAFSSMKYRTDKEAKLQVDKTEQKNINWFKNTFPCIFQSNGNVDQSVNKDGNNYVYILIKGTSGNQYQVFADGRVKKSDGTATGKKVNCQGSKVTFIGESVQKKKLAEQIDDSSLTGGSTPSPNPDPSPRPRVGMSWKDCFGTYQKGCKSDVIEKVQGCLNDDTELNLNPKLATDGKFGSKTKDALVQKGFSTFTDSDVETICKTKLPDDEYVVSADDEEGDDILKKNN
jgi:hypothetical protein